MLIFYSCSIYALTPFFFAVITFPILIKIFLKSIVFFSEIAYNIKQEMKNVKNARLMNNVLLEELNFYKKDDNEQR